MPASAGQAVPAETAMWRLQRQPLLQAFAWRWAATAACLLAALQVEEADARATKRSVTDTSVMGYLTERTCWWNEICKEEFQTLFRCKCPVWSFCRSPGRYYNAFCTMTGTGYIWTQPEPSWGRRQGAPPGDFDAADGGEPQQRARPSKNKSGKGSRSSSRATQAAGSA